MAPRWTLRPCRRRTADQAYGAHPSPWCRAALPVLSRQPRSGGRARAGCWLLLLALAACDAVAARDAARPPEPDKVVTAARAPAAAVPPASSSSVAPAKPAPSASASAALAAAGLAPLRAEGPTFALPVEGFGEAVVTLPLGATSKRPVLVATHGNYDRPEWQCYEWWKLVQERAFVLCPRGMARSDSPSADDVRFRYAHNHKLEQELAAGLAALQKRFGDYVDPKAIVYTGFSQGAIMGVAIAVRKPAEFPRVVLVEGGYDRWTRASAAAYAKGGGQRVLFACGQKGCQLAAERGAKHLERAGVATKVLYAKGQGHSYGGPVHQAIGSELGWLLSGDERWGLSAP